MAHYFGDLSQIEKRSEIKPPMKQFCFHWDNKWVVFLPKFSFFNFMCFFIFSKIMIGPNLKIKNLKIDNISLDIEFFVTIYICYATKWERQNKSFSKFCYFFRPIYFFPNKHVNVKSFCSSTPPMQWYQTSFVKKWKQFMSYEFENFDFPKFPKNVSNFCQSTKIK